MDFAVPMGWVTEKSAQKNRQSLVTFAWSGPHITVLNCVVQGIWMNNVYWKREVVVTGRCVRLAERDRVWFWCTGLPWYV